MHSVIVVLKKLKKTILTGEYTKEWCRDELFIVDDMLEFYRVLCQVVERYKYLQEGLRVLSGYLPYSRAYFKERF